MTDLELSVIIPTHNPDPVRLQRTLAGLAGQTLASERWETILVDNASTPAVPIPAPAPKIPGNLRLMHEPRLGLTSARLAGLRAARGALVVLVDDDNVLAPDYLVEVIQIFSEHPHLGVAGGPSRPEFETPPPAWAREFFPLLALRDLGPVPLLSGLERAPGSSHVLYPDFAPIGAGMALRRCATAGWIESTGGHALTDRRGSALTSGGDNDIVLTLLYGGWKVGYFPELALTHLIPASRLDPAYLAQLNRGIQTSWVQVLTRHGANPWTLVPRWTVPLRQLKAWVAFRAWSSPAARIRWQGACGHFRGRIRCKTAS
jgi:glycosyltransferase involved in cell wall biosynthesis